MLKFKKCKFPASINFCKISIEVVFVDMVLYYDTPNVKHENRKNNQYHDKSNLVNFQKQKRAVLSAVHWSIEGGKSADFFRNFRHTYLSGF